MDATMTPFITTAAYAATGSLGYALIYPIAIPAIAFVLSLFLMPETRKMSIWAPEPAVTLRAQLKPLAPGLTPRAVLDKLAAIQMLDVHFPTTDGRRLILSRYTGLNADQKLLIKQLKLYLPPQPPPRITAPGLVQSVTQPL